METNPCQAITPKKKSVPASFELGFFLPKLKSPDRGPLGLNSSKKCIKCGESKAREAFYFRPNSKDGLRNACKSCERKRVEQWRLEHPTYNKHWQSKNKERYNRWFREWGGRYAVMRKAYHAVSRKIANNHLTKKPCITCGTMENLEAHHPDYSKPLEVIWLCHQHHMELHKKERSCRKDGRGANYFLVNHA